jgi:hypothetical protein
MIGYPDGTVYPTTGTLTIQWKTRPSLSSGNTVITPTNLVSGSTGGQVDLSVPGSPGGVSSTGSFEGTDGGASDSIPFFGESTSKVFSQCFDHPGITHLVLGGMPLSLG